GGCVGCRHTRSNARRAMAPQAARAGVLLASTPRSPSLTHGWRVPHGRQPLRVYPPHMNEAPRTYGIRLARDPDFSANPVGVLGRPTVEVARRPPAPKWT